MTATEGIIGLIASVIAILTGVVFAVRWLGKKFDTWTETIIENSRAIRGLTERLTAVERIIKG